MSNSIAKIIVLANGLIFSGCNQTPPQFYITTKRDEDKVNVKVEKGITVFSIRSPFGIGQAAIERKLDKWPQDVIVRLHLQGLERLRISSDKLTIEASAAIRDEKPEVRVWVKDNEETPLDDSSRLWLEIRIHGKDNNPAKNAPLQDGYFEVSVPRAILENNTKTLKIEWIDFFRS